MGEFRSRGRVQEINVLFCFSKSPCGRWSSQVAGSNGLRLPARATRDDVRNAESDGCVLPRVFGLILEKGSVG